MQRPPVTVIVPVRNAWDTTRACLDTLRSTIGIRDQVVVVDDGSSDRTADGLRRYPWVEVVSHSGPRGFGAACNSGVAAARHDTVVILHNDTLPAGRWIEPLVQALADPGVAAAGPRTNATAGRQEVPGAAYSNRSTLRNFLKVWADAHRDETEEVGMLAGFCLAVRRAALHGTDGIGGFDEEYGAGSFEVEDLCLRLMEAGHRLVVCHEAFVHHVGRATFSANNLSWAGERERSAPRFESRHPGARVPLGPVTVSACLITKDEEERIGGCIRSLADVVDEVVVYDTGSTDATVALARELGATVVEGYWDDNFARARNESLAHCTGEWILWIDADETLHTDDPVALKSELARTKGDVDGYSVMIRNAVGAGAGSELVHHATRLFRRSTCEWAGRLHEQVARRGDHGSVVQGRLGDHVWLHHTGYLDEMMAGRNKAERNVRVAQAEVDQSDGWEKGYSLVSLGRSLVLAGRVQEALDAVTEGLDHSDNGVTRRLAVRTAIDCTLALGRTDESLEWCARMRDEGASPDAADALEASVRLGRQEWAEALALLERVSAGRTDADGFAVAAGTLAAQRAQALAALGRPAEAAGELLRALSEDGVLDTHLGALVGYLVEAGQPLEILARSIPADRSVLFMAQVLQLEPGRADMVLEACFSAGVLGRPVLATASRLAPQVGVERALIWSARLRAAGHDAGCPLIAMAGSDSDVVVRARAAAVAHRMFSDARAEELLHRAIDAAEGPAREQILVEVSQLAPELLAAAAALRPVAS